MIDNIRTTASNIGRRASQTVVGVLFTISLFAGQAAAQTTTTNPSDALVGTGLTRIVHVFYILVMLLTLLASLWFFFRSAKHSSPEKKAQDKSNGVYAFMVFVGMIMLPTILNVIENVLGVSIPITPLLPW